MDIPWGANNLFPDDEDVSNRKNGTDFSSGYVLGVISGILISAILIPILLFRGL